MPKSESPQLSGETGRLGNLAVPLPYLHGLPRALPPSSMEEPPAWPLRPRHPLRRPLRMRTSHARSPLRSRCPSRTSTRPEPPDLSCRSHEGRDTRVGKHDASTAQTSDHEVALGRHEGEQ